MHDSLPRLALEGDAYSMIAGAGQGAIGEDADHPQLIDSPQPAERITVALIPRTRGDLQRLGQRTALSKTDIVNRAITLYEFIDAQLRAGQEILIRNNRTQETQIVLFV